MKKKKEESQNMLIDPRPDILFGTRSKGFSNIKSSRPGTVSKIYLNCYSNAMRRAKQRQRETDREREIGE